jgi:hypothetical protein
MLYPKNEEQQLSKKLFQNPTSEYRGTPFWAWNTKLNKDMLLREIDQLKEMGMGGFHIHSRSGMATSYLSDEFMDLVKTCNEKAKENEMLCWLYDEDRWPSGAAGGLVTKDVKYRSRFLVFSPKQYTGNFEEDVVYDSSARAQRSENRKLLGSYEVRLEDGYLSYYKKLQEGEEPREGSKLWYAYIEVSGNSPWYNNQSYVNTLDKEAIKKFVEITHDRYYEAVGEDFGKSIPAIFTDEPQFSHKETLGYAEEEKEVILPFTDDFEDTYKETYGDSILEHLPELFWELPNGAVSLTRYRYHDHVSERFSEAFADTIGNWCKEHGIMLTGHMMEEPTLSSQTRALGEAMRSYRSFQLPGIDMLCDSREYTTAKQAQSAAHQYGAPGVLSELYGVTNWDFDFRGHKLQGDWQAALGVTVRVHHLTWVSMNGEAKRDYPACIGYQSPWYKEYPLIENHFARVNTALTRGKAKVKVGVIHPIESYWLHFGPQEQTDIIREEMENNFKNITDWMLFGLVDFDFISESLLPSQCKVEEAAPMKVGEMAYDVILVPGCETLRESTVKRLEAFKNAGGKVVFVGEPASLVNAEKSDRVESLSKDCLCIPFTRTRLMEALQEYRDIDIRKENGSRTDHLIYQMREDGDTRWLFICHAKKMNNPDIAFIERISVRVKGKWNPVVYDTMTGETYPCAASIRNGETWINHEFSQHDSLLLCLKPGKPEYNCEAREVKASAKEVSYVGSPVPVTLSEPNVLLLDMAEYSFDKGPWQSREEVLRIDNEFRKKLKFPLKMDAIAQPWVNPVIEVPEHLLSLRFSVNSEIEVKEPFLALEGAEDTEIIVNGIKVDSVVDGWFVDECIKKVKLPSLPKGRSEIVLHIPFATKTNVEWCYLLGDFGVKVTGSHAAIIEPVSELAFGDWSHQGLPFYAGNVTYHCSVECKEGELELEASQYRNPLLSVALDGEEKGKLVFAPYKLSLGKVAAGKHSVDITAYGNRVNAFGTVHNCSRSTTWFGPNAWRSEGPNWSYEYQLREMGVLISPKVRVK